MSRETGWYLSSFALYVLVAFLLPWWIIQMVLNHLSGESEPPMLCFLSDMASLIKTKPRCGVYNSLDNRYHIQPSLNKQNRSRSMPSVDWLSKHRTGGFAAPEYSAMINRLWFFIIEDVPRWYLKKKFTFSFICLIQ